MRASEAKRPAAPLPFLMPSDRSDLPLISWESPRPAGHKWTVIVLPDKAEHTISDDILRFNPAIDDSGYFGSTLWLLLHTTAAQWSAVRLIPGPDREEGRQFAGPDVYAVSSAIEREVRELSGNAERVFLLAIGRAMTVGLEALLASRLKLGAFIGASGWVQHQREEPPQSRSLPAVETPVFLTYDENYQYLTERGQNARHTIGSLGFKNITWKPNGNRKLIVQCLEIMHGTGGIGHP
jgi:hypothetical protein